MTQRIGLIGCGTISEIYLLNGPRFKDIVFVACADLVPSVAKAAAEDHAIEARPVKDLLASDDIDIILNLTIPEAHVDISLAAIEAGKHVYNEKPLATRLCDGKQILQAAGRKGLRVGCAPDTVLGSAVQTARRLIDAGEIGRPILGSAAILSHGMEMWHPNPGFFFKPGAGPVLDMGPYAFSSLATLLGPVSSVVANGQIGNAERTVTTPGSSHRGETIEVETLTTVQALLEFANGAQVSFVASWDVWNHDRAPIEIHGTEGSIILPDHNWFGGDVLIAHGQPTWKTIPTDTMTFGVSNYESGAGAVANYRGLGLADMARAIETGRPHRASGELGLHVLAVMEAILTSAKNGGAISIDVPFAEPQPLPETEARTLLREI